MAVEDASVSCNKVGCKCGCSALEVSPKLLWLWGTLRLGAIASVLRIDPIEECIHAVICEADGLSRCLFCGHTAVLEGAHA